MANLAAQRGFPLVGMRSRDWRELRSRVGALAPGHKGRIAHIVVRSLINDLLHFVDEQQFGESIAKQHVQAPLIVLGMARSGTTLLYQLLCQDPRFAYPTSAQALNPHTFLSREGMSKGVLAKVARAFNLLWAVWVYRGMNVSGLGRELDSVQVNPNTPEEDEFAMMMSGCSASLGLLFPNDWSHFTRSDQEARRRWQQSWLGFLRKLSFRYPARLLALKSPGHLVRIPWILELFPEARFVFISREPEAIFQSQKHAMKVLTGNWSFQEAAPYDLDSWGALASHEFETYTRDKNLILPGHLHELRYEDLISDPVGSLEETYAALRLPEFLTFKPYLEQELEKRRSYQPNRFPPLAPDGSQRLRRDLRAYYEAFGY